MDHIKFEENDNSLIDCVKFLFAVLIVMAHYAAEWGSFPTLIDYGFSLYIVVVPFFFMCSGYFMYKRVLCATDKKQVYKHYIFRILKLYAVWSVIYFVFKIAEWVKNGTDIASVLLYFYKSIVFSTYPTIWFLPACAIAAFMMLCFSKIGVNEKKVAVVAFALYAIGSLGYSYSFLIQDTPVNVILNIYKTVFVSSRNGVFNGFPFFFMGCWIAQNEGKKSVSFYSVTSFVFLLATVIEAVIIKVKFHSIGVDTVFMLLPFTYCFMNLLLKCGSMVSIKSGKSIRTMSTLIFLSQRIFLTGIPKLLPELMAAVCKNTWGGAIVVLGATMLVSGTIMLGSKKYKIFRYLM